MAYAYDLLERYRPDLGVAEERYEGVGDFDLDWSLNYLVRIRMFGSSDADAIIREGGVACRDGGVDVAVSRCNIPVGTV